MIQSITILFLSLFSLGQSLTPAEKMNSRTLLQQGQLVSIRLEMGQPIKFYVVGKERAKLDLKTAKFSVRKVSPLPGETLQIDEHGDYFTVPNQRHAGGEPLELAVTVQSKDQAETLHFKVDNKP
jgi:hypothetical protein